GVLESSPPPPAPAAAGPPFASRLSAGPPAGASGFFSAFSAMTRPVLPRARAKARPIMVIGLTPAKPHIGTQQRKVQNNRTASLAGSASSRIFRPAPSGRGGEKAARGRAG